MSPTSYQTAPPRGGQCMVSGRRAHHKVPTAPRAEVKGRPLGFPPMQRRARSTAIAAALVIVAGACSSGGGSGSTAKPAAKPQTTPHAPAITTKATFTARGSIRAAYVLNATQGTTLILADRAGDEVQRKVADKLGSAV